MGSMKALVEEIKLKKDTMVLKLERIDEDPKYQEMSPSKAEVKVTTPEVKVEPPKFDEVKVEKPEEETKSEEKVEEVKEEEEKMPYFEPLLDNLYLSERYLSFIATTKD